MNKMRIALVDPSGVSWKRREPLGIEYLGGLLQENDYKVKIFHPALSFKELLISLKECDPDIIGFSVMSCNFGAAVALAAEMKKTNPDIVTVFGGSHATGDPSIVRNDCIDFVIIGEGDYTFLELIRNIQAGDNPKKIAGLAYWDGKVKLTPQRESIKDLNELPFPLRSALFLNDCIDFGLNYPPPSQQRAHACMTYSRGCPYNCSFCISSKMWGRIVRYRSASSVVRELKHLQNKYGTNFVFFVDLTFNAVPQKVYELHEEMKRQKVNVYWKTEGRAEGTNLEILHTMANMGCTKLCYGVESFSKDTLRRIRKPQNIDQVITAFRLANSLGILTRASYMVGYPWETEESLRESERNLAEFLPADELRITFITPFPGTLLYEECRKQRIPIEEDLNKYTSEEPVIATSISKEALLQWKHHTLKTFYLSKQYEQRRTEKIRRFLHLKQSYEEFFEHLAKEF